MLEEQRSAGARRRWSATHWLTTAAVIALLVAMAVPFSKTRQDLAYVQRLSVQVLIVTGVLQFLSQVFLTLSMLLPLQTRVSLGFWELYLVRTGGFFVGWLLPVAGGPAVRLAYLRQRGLTYLDFAWATLLTNVLALLAAAVLAGAATGALWALVGPLPASVLAVSGGILLTSIAALLAFEFLPRLTRLPKLQRWRWLSQMSTLKTSPRVTAWVFVHGLCRHLLSFMSFGLLYQSLSRAPGSFLTGGLVYAVTSPIRMVSITPGNLGVTEWFVALVGKAMTFDVTTGLIVALAFRGVAVVAQSLGALFGWAWMALASKRSAAR